MNCRLCNHCSQPLVKRANEWPARFAARKFCGNACAYARRDRVRSVYRGTYRGSETKNAKLNEQIVPVVRELHAAGISLRQLGRGFNVNHAAIWQAVNYHTWNHVR